MSNGKREDGSPEAEGFRVRPQPPTLDLTATEVAAETPAREASAPGDATEASATAAAHGEPAEGDPAETPAAEEVPEVSSATVVPSEIDERAARIETDAPSGAYAVPPPHEPRAETDFGGGYGHAPPPSAKPSPWPGRLGALAVLLLLAAGAGVAWLWLTDTQTARDDRTAALSVRVGELEAEVRQLSARPAPIPESRMAELAARTASAEQALRQVKDLEARVSKAEAALAAPRAAAPGGAAAPERLAAVDTAVKSLYEALADLRKRVEDNAAATQAARDTAMQSSGASTAVAADIGGEIAALGKRIDALDAGLKGMQAAQAAKPDIDHAARFAAAAVALRTAVDAGSPYAAELSAVKRLAPDPAKLAPLEPFAGSGVPSADALSRELAAIAQAARRPSAAPAQNTGLLDRLQASASRLVRVRPADETGRPNPADPFAEAQAKAAHGDLAGARAELAKLPDPARAPVEPWMQRADARANALELSRALARDGLDALGKA